MSNDLARRIAGLSPEKLARFLQHLNRETKAAAELRIPARRGDLPAPPLSSAQQRLWFLDQLAPGNSFYNLAAAMELRGRLDVAALARSLNAVVARHEALRTTFPALDGQPHQVIAPALSVPLPLLDLRALPEDVGAAAAHRVAVEEAQRP